MCEPISLGIATAAAGGAKAIAGHQSATRNTYLANKGRLNQYEGQLAQRELDWNQRTGVYRQAISEYQQSGARARDALGRGYMQAQNQLSDVYKSAAFSNQQSNIQAAQAIGRAQARGQSGRSAALQAQNALSAYGRNQAILSANLLGARNRYAFDTEGLRQRYQSDRANAYSKIANRPILGAAPTKPIYADGPSKLGLIADLGSAALSGFNTYSSLKADNVLNNVPTDTPPTDTLNIDGIQDYMD